MTTSDHRHFEARIRTPSGGRHRVVVMAKDEADAHREVKRWAKDNAKKIEKVNLWEILAIPGVLDGAPTGVVG